MAASFVSSDCTWNHISCTPLLTRRRLISCSTLGKAAPLTNKNMWRDDKCLRIQWVFSECIDFLHFSVHVSIFTFRLQMGWFWSPLWIYKSTAADFAPYMVPMSIPRTSSILWIAHRACAFIILKNKRLWHDRRRKFSSGGKTTNTFKSLHVFGAPTAQTTIFALFRRFKLKYMVFMSKILGYFVGRQHVTSLFFKF